MLRISAYMAILEKRTAVHGLPVPHFPVVDGSWPGSQGGACRSREFDRDVVSGQVVAYTYKDCEVGPYMIC